MRPNLAIQGPERNQHEQDVSFRICYQIFDTCSVVYCLDMERVRFAALYITGEVFDARNRYVETSSPNHLIYTRSRSDASSSLDGHHVLSSKVQETYEKFCARENGSIRRKQCFTHYIFCLYTGLFETDLKSTKVAIYYLLLGKDFIYCYTENTPR